MFGVNHLSVRQFVGAWSVRRRLDAEMVRRGLVVSRTQAVAAIEAKTVLVGGAVAEKAARLVESGDAIVVTGEPRRFVSRGGLKLEAALDHFRIDVVDRLALDAGASTGGFTDCLLQRGAVGVIAVDVGIGQLHEKIRADARVEVHERCNVRTDALTKVMAGRRAPVLVGDLSFISLVTVASSLVDAAEPDGATMVLLVKPQFEAGRAEASKGRGVIRNPQTWSSALHSVVEAYADLGAAMMGVMTSPITGADGNVEFLAHFRTGTARSDRHDTVVRESINRLIVEIVGTPASTNDPLTVRSEAAKSNGDA